MGVKHVVRGCDQPELDHLLNSERREILVLHVPVFITFLNEVLEAHPNRILYILDHIRRPVIVNLESAHFYLAVLNIDPAVGHDIPHGLDVGFILQVQLLHQNAERHVVAVRQSLRDVQFLLGDVIHADDQILERH